MMMIFAQLMQFTRDHIFSESFKLFGQYLCNLGIKKVHENDHLRTIIDPTDNFARWETSKTF